MSEELNDFDKVFRQAAYTNEEIRHGVPLGYVGEKLRSSLMSLHFAWSIMNESLPETLPAPPHAPDGYDEKMTLLSGVFQSFRNGVKAYTGLYNWLEIIENENYYQSLLDKGHNAFNEWFELVDSRGNVLGEQ